MRKNRLYVGYIQLAAHMDGSMPRCEVFRSVNKPTKASHPQYLSVLGPFRTKAGAQVAAELHPNPHVRTVADAEHIANLRKQLGT